MSAAFLFLLRSSCYLLLLEAREMVRYGCMSVGLAVGWMFYSVLLRCDGRGEGQGPSVSFACIGMSSGFRELELAVDLCNDVTRRFFICTVPNKLLSNVLACQTDLGSMFASSCGINSGTISINPIDALIH